MNIIQRLLTEPEPDPRAVAQGLTITRIGWGRYQYSGRPTAERGNAESHSRAMIRLDLTVIDSPRTVVRGRRSDLVNGR